MQYRHFGKLNSKPSLLGFGTMRLPVINGNMPRIDENEAIRMIRHAIDLGVNYVDTAWPYHNGQSEILTGKALQDGYREKTMLATKNPTWLVKTEEDWPRLLDEQLKKLKTDNIDFYLQHALDANGWRKFKKLNLWKKAMEAKESGKIKYFGFSFHDSQDLFMEILDSYDWDFCQIQYNYLDVDYQAGLKGLEKAASKNIGVIVMEPLRGGLLASGLPADLQEEMDSFKIKRKPVEWAFRYIANHPGVSTILSGMSTFDQVNENIKICSMPDILPEHMTDEEIHFIDNLAAGWKTKKLVGCTSCKYCVPCPKGVDIPGCFSLFNLRYSTSMDARENSKKDYNKLIGKKSDASLCEACGACEKLCPQQIPIIKTLKSLHEELTE